MLGIALKSPQETPYYVVNSMTSGSGNKPLLLLYDSFYNLNHPCSTSWVIFFVLLHLEMTSFAYYCYMWPAAAALFILFVFCAFPKLTTRWACFNTLVCHTLYPIENITTLLWSYWIMEFDPSRSDMDWG